MLRLVESGYRKWFWKRRGKYDKFTRGRTDDGRQAIRKAHLIFQARNIDTFFDVDYGTNDPEVLILNIANSNPVSYLVSEHS